MYKTHQVIERVIITGLPEEVTQAVRELESGWRFVMQAPAYKGDTIKISATYQRVVANGMTFQEAVNRSK